jgi:hypothetical protein
MTGLTKSKQQHLDNLNHAVQIGKTTLTNGFVCYGIIYPSVLIKNNPQKWTTSILLSCKQSLVKQSIIYCFDQSYEKNCNI